MGTWRVLSRTSERRGWTLAELLTVLGICSVLLLLGFLYQGSLRRSARVARAESRLMQIATGLDLYFGEHHTYPAEGADLSTELAAYVASPAIFENPLREEEWAGQDISGLYVELPPFLVDRSGNYITCFPSGDRRDPIVCLETGARVTRKPNPGYVPGVTQRSALLAFLYPQHGVTLSGWPADDSSGEKVPYVVVRDGPSTVKFEDAPEGLGEEGAQQTDIFEIPVTGASTSVVATTKAGGRSAANVLPVTPGASVHDSLGFVTTFLGAKDGVYRLAVSSVDNRDALSHVEFYFAGAEVTAPAGSQQVPRWTDEPAETTSGGDEDSGVRPSRGGGRRH